MRKNDTDNIRTSDDWVGYINYGTKKELGTLGLKNIECWSSDLSKMHGWNENHLIHWWGMADSQNTDAPEPVGNKKSWLTGKW